MLRKGVMSVENRDRTAETLMLHRVINKCLFASIPRPLEKILPARTSLYVCYRTVRRDGCLYRFVVDGKTQLGAPEELIDLRDLKFEPCVAPPEATVCETGAHRAVRF